MSTASTTINTIDDLVSEARSLANQLEHSATADVINKLADAVAQLSALVGDLDADLGAV
jgi:hypothetical protein